MRISITNGDMDLSNEQHESIESRLRLSLSRFSSKIARISVEVSTIDTPKGHKKCRMELFLRPSRKIVLENTDAEIQAAVDRTAVQMARSVERQLRRDRLLNGKM